MSTVEIPLKIIYKQAPCKPDGEITCDGQEESKEGTCRCSANPEGCCVDSLGIIIPRVLTDDTPLPTAN